MAIDFSNIRLEVVDLNINATPDIYINQSAITFSKRVLEDLAYPQYVQYCMDASQKIFAIRSCKGTETKATIFAKPKAEQSSTLSFTNKNLRDVITALIPEYDRKQRYKVTGEFDAENRVMYFDMANAKESNFRKNMAE
jgi:hypothetical protein